MADDTGIDDSVDTSTDDDNDDDSTEVVNNRKVAGVVQDEILYYLSQLYLNGFNDGQIRDNGTISLDKINDTVGIDAATASAFNKIIYALTINGYIDGAVGDDNVYLNNSGDTLHY